MSPASGKTGRVMPLGKCRVGWAARLYFLRQDSGSPDLKLRVNPYTLNHPNHRISPRH